MHQRQARPHIGTHQVQCLPLPRPSASALSPLNIRVFLELVEKRYNQPFIGQPSPTKYLRKRVVNVKLCDYLERVSAPNLATLLAYGS